MPFLPPNQQRQSREGNSSPDTKFPFPENHHLPIVIPPRLVGRLWVKLHTTQRATHSSIITAKRMCADTLGTVPVPWAGHFQC